MKILRIFAVLLISSVSLAPCVSAQLHESIDVEGEYAPEIILHEKVNYLPREVDFSLPHSNMRYDLTGDVVDFVPVIYPMAATGWNTTADFPQKRGYLFLGAGSMLNSTLAAGYSLNLNQKSTLGFRLQHNSTSLWRPELYGDKSPFRQFRYDETIGVFGNCSVSGRGSLIYSLDYSLRYFNYYGAYDGMSMTSEECAASQTSNQVRFHAGWLPGHNNESTMSYGFAADIDYLSYRSLPLPILWNQSSAKGNRETRLTFSGDLSAKWGHSKIGLVADMSMLFYGGPDELFNYYGPGLSSHSLSRPDNYGMLRIKPFYTRETDNVTLRAGMEIDLTARAGLSGHRYPFFHISPDLSALYSEGVFTGLLSIGGGSELNTLSSLRLQDYYAMPALTNTCPVYTPFDAKLLLKVSPLSGLDIEAGIRFKVSRGVRLGGWYQAWVDFGPLSMPGMSSSPDEGNFPLYSLDSEGINLHGVRIDGKISYTLKKILSLNLKGAWQPQKGKIGFFDGYDRPRVTAGAEMEVSPISPLFLTLAYEYRGVRRIYTREYCEPLLGGGIINGSLENRLVSLKLPDLTLLNVRGSWKFNHDFAVWLEISNLLNRHDWTLPMLPMQGIGVMAGLDWLF